MSVADSKFAELKKRENQARRQIVIDSTRLLFAKRPFYEVGMREVADETGISPATIYRYFSGQAELFHEAFLQEISSASKEFKTLVIKENPVSIQEFAIKFVAHLIENESTFQMMTYLMLKDNLADPVMGKFDSVTKIFFDLFEQLLIRHGAKEKNVRLHAHSFIASLAGIFNDVSQLSLKG